MIISDFNKMTVEELYIIYSRVGLEYEINDGKIVGTVKIPTQTVKSE